ncbi:MAG TPA: Ig-like domain-containing protein [Candidatus Bathyarchaeia archaeon]|nr:Ig-like domain-containing protein [Candidatus Bathyarchaeia archaeon]
MAPYRQKSRLIRKERQKSLQRTYLFTVLTLLLVIAILFLGIPLLIKLAAFLGEIRSSSIVIEKNDTIPPPTPQTYALPKAVKEPEIKLEGSSESNSKVSIYVNGQLVKEVITDKEGVFTAQLPLPSKRNEIILQAEDQAGNKSQESERKVVIYDNEPPLLEIIMPEGTEVTWDKNQIEIAGRTEPEASLYLNDRLVILNQDGNFKYLLTLAEGENLVKISAKDEAENLTEKEITIIYTPF